MAMAHGAATAYIHDATAPAPPHSPAGQLAVAACLQLGSSEQRYAMLAGIGISIQQIYAVAIAIVYRVRYTGSQLTTVLHSLRQQQVRQSHIKPRGKGSGTG
jgi:hypothetical protein